MDAEEFFANGWPELVSDLRRMLAKAGAPLHEQDDLVQETALRLLRMWDAIDPERPVAPLAARIALNAWRDHWRRLGSREQLGPVPDAVGTADTERAGLARVEVRDVARALARLRPETAGILRRAISDSAGLTARVPGPATPAQRMARSRARRTLVANLAMSTGTTVAAA